MGGSLQSLFKNTQKRVPLLNKKTHPPVFWSSFGLPRTFQFASHTHPATPNSGWNQDGYITYAMLEEKVNSPEVGEAKQLGEELSYFRGMPSMAQNLRALRFLHPNWVPALLGCPTETPSKTMVKHHVQ